jgi:signal transduction histidine kinase
MLGRQQIAGIQNAISELFKNAHDAYAGRAEIDYFEEDNLLVIRDDGVGMTKADFEGKWLVLGTESKAGDGGKNQYRPPGTEERPITGEKGIGRLAIALLGRQLLVLSRARRADGVQDLVMSLVHWGIFELPGINLDEIDVPVETVPGGALPGEAEVAELKGRLIESLKSVAEAHPDLKINEIIREVKEFKPDPSDLELFFRDREQQPLSLAGESAGTHFIIGPANPIVRIEMAAEAGSESFNFRKHLMGFCNEVFLEDTPAPIRTAFRKWVPGAVVGEDLLDPGLFFSKAEVESADHLISGAVDEYGQFSGSVRVFDQVFEKQIIPWQENAGKRTECGKFSIQFGYLMGERKESRLSPEEHARLAGKLERLGGLYIYRDRIRVLPYGDNQFDWLDIERRRTLGASYYFFSYRRLFGAIQITRRRNERLQEKAGREGFQQNQAYRQLRQILVNLFLNLAAEFFRKGGTKAEYFETKREEHARMAAALERREKQVATKRRKLDAALGAFFERTKPGLPESEVATLRQLTRARMEAASKVEDKDQAAAALISLEKEAVTSLQKLRDSYVVKRPGGVGLTKALRRDWDAYLEETERLEAEVFGPLGEEIATTVGEVAAEAKLYVDQRKRLEERLRTLAEQRQKDLQEAVAQARAVASDTRATVFDVTQKAVFALDDTVKRIEADISRRDLESLSPKEIEKLRKGWESELTSLEAKHREALVATRNMLASLSENLKTSQVESPAQLVEALEERMLALEEQSDADFEMVQLGLAVAIINHEFVATIRNVRRSLQELGYISQRSEAVKPLYEAIRDNFQHLDGHLNLFTPLQRRLYRKPVRVEGKSIRNYVRELFANRRERHHVEFRYSEVFEKSWVECYPSTIYPVFINIVDNAIYWLGTSKDERAVLFDAGEKGFLIANTGPAVANRDREAIFERGFTRKPAGRGLGLFIAKRALQEEKMDIDLVEPPKGYNVAFQIKIPSIHLSL